MSKYAEDLHGATLEAVWALADMVVLIKDMMLDKAIQGEILVFEGQRNTKSAIVHRQGEGCKSEWEVTLGMIEGKLRSNYFIIPYNEWKRVINHIRCWEEIALIKEELIKLSYKEKEFKVECWVESIK